MFLYNVLQLPSPLPTRLPQRKQAEKKKEDQELFSVVSARFRGLGDSVSQILRSLARTSALLARTPRKDANKRPKNGNERAETCMTQFMSSSHILFLPAVFLQACFVSFSPLFLLLSFLTLRRNDSSVRNGGAFQVYRQTVSSLSFLALRSLTRHDG